MTDWYDATSLDFSSVMNFDDGSVNTDENALNAKKKNNVSEKTTKSREDDDADEKAETALLMELVKTVFVPDVG